TVELAERIGPLKQRSRRLAWAQSLERDLRTHFKVYEPTRGADDRHDVGVGDPPAPRRHDHVSDHGQLFRQLSLLGAEIGLALFGEQLGDLAAFAALDLEVEFDEAPAESLRHRLADGGFSRSRQPDEDDVRPRWISGRAGLRRAKG